MGLHRNRHADFIERTRRLVRIAAGHAAHGLRAAVDVDGLREIGAAEAVRIVGAITRERLALLALSANSPFWRGEPTGFASCRHLIFSAFPRSGLPPHFRDFSNPATELWVPIAFNEDDASISLNVLANDPGSAQIWSLDQNALNAPGSGITPSLLDQCATRIREQCGDDDACEEFEGGPFLVNLLDGCALTLPCHAQGEWPVGLMLWGPALADDRVLSLALAVEAALQPLRGGVSTAEQPQVLLLADVGGWCT